MWILYGSIRKTRESNPRIYGQISNQHKYGKGWELANILGHRIWCNRSVIWYLQLFLRRLYCLTIIIYGCAAWPFKDLILCYRRTVLSPLYMTSRLSTFTWNSHKRKAFISALVYIGLREPLETYTCSTLGFRTATAWDYSSYAHNYPGGAD